MGKWSDKAKNAAPASTGKYIKLKGIGDSIRFCVTDADEGQETTSWKDGKKVPIGTPGCETGTKIVASVFDPAQKCDRVLRMTPAAFAKLAEKVDEFGEDRVYQLKIVKGKGQYNEYVVDQVDRMTADQLKDRANAERIDVLAEDGVVPIPTKEEPTPQPSRPAALPKGAAPAPADDADIPF